MLHGLGAGNHRAALAMIALVAKAQLSYKGGRQGRQEIFISIGDRPAPAAGSATGCSGNNREIHAAIA